MINDSAMIKRTFERLQEEAVCFGVLAVEDTLKDYFANHAPQRERAGLRRAIRACEKIRKKLRIPLTATFDRLWRGHASAGRADAEGGAQYTRALEDYAKCSLKVDSISDWLMDWLRKDDRRET